MALLYHTDLTFLLLTVQFPFSRTFYTYEFIFRINYVYCIGIFHNIICIFYFIKISVEDTYYSLQECY